MPLGLVQSPADGRTQERRAGDEAAQLPEIFQQEWGSQGDEQYRHERSNSELVRVSHKHAQGTEGTDEHWEDLPEGSLVGNDALVPVLVTYARNHHELIEDEDADAVDAGKEPVCA